uniref:Uncharacterized protein n=1 Tax=Melopsittacus undulatus TaxID=13146 RepID=A0A8V5GM00_MELUD
MLWGSGGLIKWNSCLGEGVLWCFRSKKHLHNVYRQEGWRDVTSTPGFAQLGRGALPIWQDDLNCSGRSCSQQAEGMGTPHLQVHGGTQCCVLMYIQLQVGKGSIPSPALALLRDGGCEEMCPMQAAVLCMCVCVCVHFADWLRVSVCLRGYLSPMEEEQRLRLTYSHLQVKNGLVLLHRVSAGSPSSVYIIQPTGLDPIVVYCEMTEPEGGWTVIQRNRQSTEITWAESWSTYKYGFGDVHTEYWLGTEYIHHITKQKVYQVRFVIWDATDNIHFADYNLFSVEDEPHGYRLRLGSYSGSAGDAMTSDNPRKVHNNMKFSTKDRDQDTYRGNCNCAYSYEGGWWFSACYSVRLNFKGGMTWGSLCKGNCKSSLILIKPVGIRRHYRGKRSLQE